MVQLVSLLTLGTSAQAGEWHADALFRTDFPAFLGVSGVVETPQRLRASVSVGLLPDPYVDGIQWVATSAGWYDDLTASLIDAALKRSLLIRPEIGFRPFRKHGWRFDAGYQFVSLGGALTGAETLAAVGYEAEPTGESALQIDVRATLHMITIGTGWDFVVKERLVLGLGLGGAFTLASKTTIDVPEIERRRPGAAGNPGLEAAANSGEEYLEDVLRSYIHTPYVSAAIGYRFR